MLKSQSDTMEISKNLFKKPLEPPIRKKRKILSEEKYIKNVSDIIEQDFFPDLDKLKDKLECIDEFETNNTYKMNELHSKFGLPLSNPEESPSTFDTPVNNAASTPDVHINIEREDHNDANCSEKSNTNENQTDKPTLTMSLDKFMSNYTSEDNENFDQMMIDKDQKFRMKNPWLFKAEEVHNSNYAPNMELPSIEQQKESKVLAITGMSDPNKDTRKKTVENWHYKTFNSVMFVPDAAPQSQTQLVELAKLQKQEVKAENTRFQENPFNEAVSQATMLEASAIQAYKEEGKVGVDGKEIRDNPVYNLCPAPSPKPGVDASPLMTWGHIEGTPLQMEGSRTPLLRGSNHGPSYKIPKASSRDELLKTLNEKVSETQREKKNKALTAAKSKLKSPFTGRSTPISSMERLSSMSPAAQRLLTQKLGVKRDSSLSASYSPSPLRSSFGTPSPNSKRGPSPVIHSSKMKRAQTPLLETGLTDNLLNLPTRNEKTPVSRPSAADFFD